jgi:hypothetical protein
VDQHAGAGHHAITREAVRQFFASGRAVGGKIDGMTEDEYYHALDAAQEHADRLVETTPVTVAGHTTNVPTGSGPTTHNAWTDGAAQREHGMADPHHTGQWNLDTDRQFVEDQVAASRTGDRVAHLGAAAHALEDSYSEAHAFRTHAADSGDPTAAVQSFNVFDPTPGAVHGGVRTGGVVSGLDETHDERFDQVAVDPTTGALIHGTDRAAAAATAQLLEAAYDGEHQPDAAAAGHVHDTVGQFYQGAPGGVGVNIAADPAWEAERDRRLAEHQQEDAAHAAAAQAEAQQRAEAADYAARQAHANDDFGGGAAPGGVPLPDASADQ